MEIKVLKFKKKDKDLTLATCNVLQCEADLFCTRISSYVDTKKTTRKIPRDSGECQHHALVLIESDGRFSVITVPTVLHQSLKHRWSTESL
jgi:hypothetical protein